MSKNQLRKPKGPGGGQFTSTQVAASKRAHGLTEKIHDEDNKDSANQLMLMGSLKATKTLTPEERAKHHEDVAWGHNKAHWYHKAKFDFSGARAHKAARDAHREAADSYIKPSKTKRLKRWFLGPDSFAGLIDSSMSSNNGVSFSMLVEKEVISPGCYWYSDQKTGVPRKLDVTPELTRYWHEQGSKMLAAGLQIPVPYEHDFQAHPMTPREKLLNNAGEVKEYCMKGDALYSIVDVQDPDVKSKIGKSIRWTSPWITSFTDGNGQQWNNVIAHLALTTRPRITKQQPFESVAAALSLADDVVFNPAGTSRSPVNFCLSRAGRLVEVGEHLLPQYPMAFSLWSGAPPLNVSLAGGNMPFPKKKPPMADEEEDTTPEEGEEDEEGGEGEEPGEGMEDMEGLEDQPGEATPGEIKMEELLCDLLQALGVPMPDESNETEFKRHLYEAVMSKIKELTSKGMGGQDPNKMNGAPDQNKLPNEQQPNASHPNKAKPNPLVQQEQQPMYMSLEEINKLPPREREIALGVMDKIKKGAAFGPTSVMDRVRGKVQGSMASLRGSKVGQAVGSVARKAKGSKVGQAIGRQAKKAWGGVKTGAGKVHEKIGKARQWLRDLRGRFGKKKSDAPSPERSEGGFRHYGATASLGMAMSSEAEELESVLNELDSLLAEYEESDDEEYDEEEDNPAMFMSLEDINELPDPMKGVALAMYAENQRLRAHLGEQQQVTDSLRDARLKEANLTRLTRVATLSRFSPRVKSDLTAMLALPQMALSLGDGGEVVDPLDSTLAVLEKSLGDMPHLMTTPSSALSAAPHPTDDQMLTAEQEDEIANGLARQMGCPAQDKAS